MNLSDFGNKIAADSGILRLMDDLGKAMAGGDHIAMFGGGNPAHIPEVTQAYKQSLHALVQEETKLAAMLGNYDEPRGGQDFIRTFVQFMNDRFDFGITDENVAITPGSQAGYFMLFNLLAGKSGTEQKKILFPIVPEYVGYSDQALEPGTFVSRRPHIEKIGDHEFKYTVDFDNLDVSDDIAAMCVSRPTNPSGNVISDEEVRKLADVAESHDIPLIIDNAYGLPFPGVLTDSASLIKHPAIVHSFSLSKVGLPASRVGVFVGPKELMRALSSANAILNLASPSFGQYIAAPLLKDGSIMELSKNAIQPYYADRAAKAKKLINQYFPDRPWRLHEYDGSYFFWLWCENMKIGSYELYDRLKKRGVLVVPGEYFFAGQDPADWPHVGECIRINFARPDKELEAGIPILAEEIDRAYS